VAGFEDEDDDEDENEAPHEWRQNVITQRIAALDGLIAYQSGASFRAPVLLTSNPGLKPWA
jgi:hypothetical protein